MRPGSRVQAEFPNAQCSGVSVAWSKDGGKALVHFGEPASLFEVTVASGEKRALPLPPAGDFDEVGYDAKGRVLMLTSQAFDREVTFEGKKYVANKSFIGAPALAHAWALEGEKWSRLETKVTGAEACSAPGSSVLKTHALLVRPVKAAVQGVPTKSELERLNAAAPLPKPAEGEWAKYGDVFAWTSVFGDYERPTGRLAVQEKGRMRMVETGFTLDEPVTLDARGGVLLVTTYKAARVIELSSGATSFSSDDVYAAELR